MRTTVTLDPDVESLVKRAMRERGVGFKVALNDALRAGLGAEQGGGPVESPSFDMGTPRVELTKALRIAGELEAAEHRTRLGRGA